MSPTLKLGDILFVHPYDGRRIRRGDVVVFRSSGRTLPVVHRVLFQDTQGIITIGDNNDSVDSDCSEPCHIAGRVVYAQKGTKLRHVHGGSVGNLIGGAMRLRRRMHTRLCKVLHPIYDGLARSGTFGDGMCSRCEPGLFPLEETVKLSCSFFGVPLRYGGLYPSSMPGR